MKIFNLSQNWWQFLLIALVCYVIGSFNFARAISKKKHKDITKMGSGNPGAMNMTREFGLKIGLLTFVCDAFKGGIPAVVCFFLYKNFVFAGTQLLVSDFIRYYCGVFVVLGHIYPYNMKFKGGKGIAATFGLFWMSIACENAWWLLGGCLCFALVILYIYCTEWGSMGSLIGVAMFSIIQMVIFVQKYAKMPVNAYMVCLYLIIFLINILTWAAHGKNLSRLLSGEEHHTSIKKLARKK